MSQLRIKRLLVLAAAGLLWSGVPFAADEHEHHHPAEAADPHAAHKAAAAQSSGSEAAQVRLTDTALVTQDGKPVKFKSDVLGEKIVVIDFVYTTCTTVCPVVSALFANLQERLGPDLGKEVALVSVTVDPLRDTPQRLKELGAKYKAGPGWTFLTGKKPQVDEVLKAFGAYTANFAEHPPLVMVGDAKSGQWVRFFAFTSPDQVMAAVGDLRAARHNHN